MQLCLVFSIFPLKVCHINDELIVHVGQELLSAAQHLVELNCAVHVLVELRHRPSIELLDVLIIYVYDWLPPIVYCRVPQLMIESPQRVADVLIAYMTATTTTRRMPVVLMVYKLFY